MERNMKKEEEYSENWTDHIHQKQKQNFVKKEKNIKSNVEIAEPIFIDVNKHNIKHSYENYQHFLCREEFEDGNTSLPKNSPVVKGHNLEDNESLLKHSEFIENKTNNNEQLKEDKQIPQLQTFHDAKTEHCKFCDFITSDNSNLKQHIELNHQRIKNLKCDLCDYRTTNNTHLKRHINCIHIKEKSFNCEYCDYNTYNACNLKRHVDCIHLRVRNRKCQFCGYSTSNVSNLKYHINSVHHKVKVHECKYCKYSTNNMSHLKRHTDRVHQDLMNS